MSFLGLYLVTLFGGTLLSSGEAIPPQAKAQDPKRGASEEPGLPWKLDTPYRYLWLRAGQKVGETRFEIKRAKEGERSFVYILTARRSYDREGASHRSEETTVFKADGTPLKFEETLDFSTIGKVRSHQVTTIEFVGQRAKVKYVQNGNEGEPNLQTVELPSGTFLTASQAVEHWAILMSRLPLEFEKEKVNLFYPDFHKVLEVTFLKAEQEKLKLGKDELETTRARFRSETGELQGTAWRDARGRLIQIEFPNPKAKELSLRVVLVEGE
jgi:hypothetical protein